MTDGVPATGDEVEQRAAWMQRADGSWWAVDEYGIAWPVAAFTENELEDDARAALVAFSRSAVVDVEALDVTDTEASQ